MADIPTGRIVLGSTREDINSTFPTKNAKLVRTECEQCAKLKKTNADLLEACKLALPILLVASSELHTREAKIVQAAIRRAEGKE